jgi:hypothetical protein
MIERVLDLDIAARSRVADHDEIGRGDEVARVEAVKGLDPEPPQLVRHRRVEGLVRSGHAVALCFEQSGERGHGGPTDPDQMNVLFLHLERGGVLPGLVIPAIIAKIGKCEEAERASDLNSRPRSDRLIRP